MKPSDTLTEQERQTVADYDRNAALRQRGPDYWLSDIIQFTEFVPNGRILEIGSGSGVEGGTFSSLGYDYCGIDISAGYLAEARRNFPHLRFEHMSVYNLDYPDASFEGAWSGNTLYHLPKQRLGEALGEIRRVLKPQGVCFFSLPRGEGESMWSKQSFGYESCRLWSRYCADEVVEIMDQAGLQLLQLDFKRSNGSGQADQVINWLLFYAQAS